MGIKQQGESETSAQNSLDCQNSPLFLLKQTTLCFFLSLALLLSCGELPNPQNPLWEPRNQALNSCLMPVSFCLPLSSGWSGERFGGGSTLPTLLPSLFLETCFNRESMQCILLSYNPQLYCNWGIRDWTSGGDHTHFRLEEEEEGREGGKGRERESERESLPFHTNQ